MDQIEKSTGSGLDHQKDMTVTITDEFDAMECAPRRCYRKSGRQDSTAGSRPHPPSSPRTSRLSKNANRNVLLGTVIFDGQHSRQCRAVGHGAGCRKTTGRKTTTTTGTSGTGGTRIRTAWSDEVAEVWNCLTTHITLINTTTFNVKKNVLSQYYDKVALRLRVRTCEC